MIAGILWVVFTALAVAGVAAMNPFPTVGAEEAEFSDHAFRLMSYMGAPVLGFVLAALVYSVLRFRSPGEPSEDGPPFKGTGMVPRAWLGVTTGLAVLIMIYPGLTGLAELRSDRTYDLEVNVTGFRWSWAVQYPEGEFSSNEIVLPKDQRVKFNITAPAGDVLHSFWIPAFRLKIDAVPGQTTHLYITPNEVGDGATDASYRVQCAELCGLFHHNMRMNVRVVEPDEFEAWVAEKAGN
ncbi:MAG: cytochrome c oxidase subunit II [Dehalococcoidia bacterium]